MSVKRERPEGSTKSSAERRRTVKASKKSAPPPKRPPRRAPDKGSEADPGLLSDALEQAAERVRRMEQQVAELRKRAPDALERAADVFVHELKRLLGGEAPDDEAVRRAARQTFAEQAWERRIGSLVDASDVVVLLGVSRQHVNNLANHGRLIALPYEGRRRFPAWQFAGTNGAQRSCLASAHRELVETGHLSPWSAASWMQAEHPELDGEDPVAFLRHGGDPERVMTAASRDAGRAAQ